MMDEILHTGKVLEITPQFITVGIVSESACASCHARGLCSLGDSKEKEVIVPTPVTEFYEIGEEVNLSLKASMGHKAVWIAYAFPLVVLCLAILVSSALGATELFSGLCGIGSVAIYYLIVFLLRNILRNEYIFKISKKS